MSNKEKTLILYDSVEYFMEYMRSSNVNVERIYRKRNIVISFLKKVFLKIGLFCNPWYGTWIKSLHLYQNIIIFATRDYTFIKHIKRTYPHIRIIFWYWNPAFRMGIPKNKLYKLAEIYSFDPADCVKYNLSFNTTFYFKEISLEKREIVYDTFFLGINKGRRDYLNRLEKTLSQFSLKNYFYIVPDKNEENPENIRPIPYFEYLNMLSASRCIIDIIPLGQSGLTLRAMESIFLKKKLITNDLTIVDQDFYSSSNIFVLGKDSLESIYSFVHTPYKELNLDIVHRYDFRNWLGRFNING